MPARRPARAQRSRRLLSYARAVPALPRRPAQRVELLVHSASEVATPRGSSPRSGKELDEIQIVRDGAVAIDRGRIVAVGPTSDLRARYTAANELDAKHGLVVPGFVDAHTHPVFA